MSIVVDIARGLAYLHTAERKRPLVHRDVKRYGGGGISEKPSLVPRPSSPTSPFATPRIDLQPPNR